MRMWKRANGSWPNWCRRFPELTSVLWTINPKKNDTIFDLDIHVFHGRDHIVEELPDGPGGKPLRFRIGPKTFFQTNPEQTIAMYKLGARTGRSYR